MQEVRPYTDQVIQRLGNLDDYYTEQADSANGAFRALMIVTLLFYRGNCRLFCMVRKSLGKPYF